MNMQTSLFQDLQSNGLNYGTAVTANNATSKAKKMKMFPDDSSSESMHI